MANIGDDVIHLKTMFDPQDLKKLKSCASGNKGLLILAVILIIASIALSYYLLYTPETILGKIHFSEMDLAYQESVKRYDAYETTTSLEIELLTKNKENLGKILVAGKAGIVGIYLSLALIFLVHGISILGFYINFRNLYKILSKYLV